MTGPMVTVMRGRSVRSWPTHEQGDRVYALPLGRALERSYTTDAHFAQYRSPRGRRLSSGAVEHEPVTLEVIVFDIDCDETHGTSEPAPEVWRSEMRAKMYHLAESHPNPHYYETRGGARIVYAQSTPTVLAQAADVRTWKQDYAITAAYLARRFGIVADLSCADWTRLFRLPHATREEGSAPESWLTVGDPNNVGVLLIEPTEADLTSAKQSSKAFGGTQRFEFSSAPTSGQGVLYHLLSARGSVIGRHGVAYVIRCPREEQHSCGRAGDGSTLLYPPAVGGETGAIHCLHAHCAHLSVGDWMREFTATERATAREAAGVRGAA